MESITITKNQLFIIDKDTDYKIEVAENVTAKILDKSNSSNIMLNCAANSATIHCKMFGSSNIIVTQQGSSLIRSYLYPISKANDKISMQVQLKDKHANCEIFCLSVTKDDQMSNINLDIEHMNSECTSNTISRGVHFDESIANFTGKITVHSGASKTIADLQIKNILCSPQAQANTKPELEIYNDDVKCSHGSATGQIDKDILFYMRSRGIGIDQAMRMIIESFISPTLGCSIESVDESISKYIAEII